MSWIGKNLSQFDPFKNGELSGLCEIPLSELAILTLSAQHCLGTVDPSVVARFLDSLEAANHSPTYRERPFREPETMVPHLVVAAALERGGRLDGREFRTSFERLVEVSSVTAPALPPHRMMELHHALDLSGVNHRLPSYQMLYRRTMAAQPVNPIYVSRAESYVLTHVIFYAADLGHRPAEGISEDEIKRLAKLVRSLLGMYIIACDWDLTAELLLSAQCLRQPTRFDDLGWEALASAQRPDGAVPGLRARLREDQVTGSGMGAESEAESCYHTTLVSALAGLAVLSGR